MSSVTAGPLRFEVDHRRPGPGGGPTLRVREARGGRELLRFDCFAEDGHWHLDPGRRDEITRFEAGVDSLEWVMAELRRDLAGWLARVDAAIPVPSDRDAAGALCEVEGALRNPPVDLDAVCPADRRPSHGEKWTTYAEDVLPVWVADMDFPIALPIQRVLATAVERSDLGYPIYPRPNDVAEIAVARMEERFGWRPDPGHVEIINEVVQGLYVTLEQFSERGDGVVVQTPIYPPFLESVREMGRRLVENPLAQGDGGFEVDLDALRAAVDAGTRMVLLCNPHNPTGRAFRRAELEGIASVALESDLTVVTDEIHGDLVYPGNRHIPFASLSPEVAARTVTLTSASKAFNIAGLRCGVAIFGSDEVAERFRAFPRHLRGGVSLPGIEALRAAWRDSQPWLDRVLTYLEANRDFVVRTVRQELPDIRVHAPEATYLAWLDCRELALEPSPYAFFLKRGRVALSNGAAFGEPGRGYVRINFATSRSIVAEALERMIKALR